MSRRTARRESRFGSDSFLDIIANIVGILIILIVVAGVRVSQAPVIPGDRPPGGEGREVESPLAALGEDEDDKESAKPEGGAAAALRAVAPAPPARPPRPSPTLLARVDRLRADVDALRSQRSAEERRRRQVAREQREAEGTLARLQRALAEERAKAEQARNTLAGMKAELEAKQARLRRTRFRLSKAERDSPPAKQIRHRLTPVGRVVEGEEVHFHLRRNRVAHVPLEELLGRLKRQVARRKNWLVKFRTHEGKVGPVRGFTMQYVVQRQRLSVLQELRTGRGMIRIGVSQWQLKPSPNLAAETAEQALRPGSDFHRALLSSDRDATLTFWVYPDSFELYRALQQVAHEEGFTVAARPLPFGIPISGSPHGSRSVGQ